MTESSAPTHAPHLQAWLDRFFDQYYTLRPVNATFIGRHEHDRALPDWSDAGLRDTVAQMRDLLGELEALPTEDPDPVERVDREIARGFLEIQIWERSSENFQRGNPALFTGEAVFGLMSHLLSDYAPLPDRVESMLARMSLVPEFLRQGTTTVTSAPAAWTQRALRECGAAVAFLREGLPTVGPLPPSLGSTVARAAESCANAFETHAVALQRNLPACSPDRVACGGASLQRLLAVGHFLDESVEEVLAYAESALQEAQSSLLERSRLLGTDPPAALLARLEDLHPDLDQYLDRYREIWDAMRAKCLERDLLTWPEFPIRYVPRPAWSRAAAPDLYFLFYRSPATFNRPRVHEYLVTPIDDEVPVDQRLPLLRAHNDSVIKLNHVVHHGGIGHHVQNWHAARARSRIGQVAAVDCASRIAMFAGGTMAEGWACYATDLMAEQGGLTPLEALAEARSRVRMCARAIVDVSLHTGRWTFAECAAFYASTAAMSPESAESEVVKNSMFPGAALMYLMGTDGVHAVRRREQTRLGDRFGLRAFHDRFLSFGSIPVQLAGKLMMETEA